MTNISSGLEHQIATGQWKTIQLRDIMVYLPCMSCSSMQWMFFISFKLKTELWNNVFSPLFWVPSSNHSGTLWCRHWYKLLTNIICVFIWFENVNATNHSSQCARSQKPGKPNMKWVQHWWQGNVSLNVGYTVEHHLNHLCILQVHLTKTRGHQRVSVSVPHQPP